MQVLLLSLKSETSLGSIDLRTPRFPDICGSYTPAPPSIPTLQDAGHSRNAAAPSISIERPPALRDFWHMCIYSKSNCMLLYIDTFLTSLLISSSMPLYWHRHCRLEGGSAYSPHTGISARAESDHGLWWYQEILMHLLLRGRTQSHWNALAFVLSP
jgi:hypothetical protein